MSSVDLRVLTQRALMLDPAVTIRRGYGAPPTATDRRSPRLNPHPHKPGVYFVPSPLGEGLVWNGWIGGEVARSIHPVCEGGD